MIKETIALADINFEDYDAVFYPGGHGPLWDLAEDKTSAKLIQDFYAANKPVAQNSVEKPSETLESKGEEKDDLPF